MLPVLTKPFYYILSEHPKFLWGSSHCDWYLGLKFRDLTDALGLVSEVTTLACGRIHDHMLVQVTPSCVALCSMEGVSSSGSSSVPTESDNGAQQ